MSYEVLEVLAGKAPDSFHALSPCALPIRRGERILVGRVNGMQVAFPALSTEESDSQSLFRARALTIRSSGPLRVGCGKLQLIAAAAA